MEWLKDERRFWVGSALTLGVLAGLKGLQMPGPWPLTAAELDYSQGLVKRGLPGWVYGHLGLRQQAGLSVAFFLQLLALLVLLALWARRSGMEARLAPVIAVFASSYATTFLFHIVGYSDILNASLLVGLLLIRSAGWRFALALPLCVAGLLIHENFLLLFAPTLLLSFWLDGLDLKARVRRAWLYGIMLAVTLAVTAAGLLLHPKPSVPAINALADVAWDNADFPVREDYYQILIVTLDQNLKWMSEVGWRQYGWWLDQAVGLCVFVPAMLVLMHSCLRTLRASGAGNWAKALVWFAALTPLLLNLIALDSMRWDMWTVVDAFLILGLLSRRWPDAMVRINSEGRNAIVLVIALNMASGWGMFGKVTINPYPFFPRALGELIRNHDVTLPGF